MNKKVLAALTGYDLGKLKLRYNELGSQAVCINQK